MPKYIVSVAFEVWLDITIDAVSHQEAEDIARNQVSNYSLTEVAQKINECGGFFEMSDQITITTVGEDA